MKLILATLIVAAATLATSATASAAGTRIVVSGSKFGSMLWGPNRQAICGSSAIASSNPAATAPAPRPRHQSTPSAGPVAGRGARKTLLGTIRRRDGRLQVTYRGRPLYYYAHEGAGEVRCHDVNLNGGLWWVIGADGKPRP